MKVKNPDTDTSKNGQVQKVLKLYFDISSINNIRYALRSSFLNIRWVGKNWHGFHFSLFSHFYPFFKYRNRDLNFTSSWI